MSGYSVWAMILILATMSIMDIRRRRVPNWAMLVFLIIGYFITGSLSYALNVVIGFGLYCTATYYIRGAWKFGGGDIKAVAIVSGIIGVQSSMLAVGVALIMTMYHRFILMRQDVAFVPYLFIGVLVVYLFR